MSRYYSSQQYERLDDPDWNPEASESNVDLGSYEPYRSQTGADADADEAPLNREGTAYQQPVPSAYINSRYPRKGWRGLKSKHWDTWSGRKKVIVVASAVAIFLILIAIAVGVGVEETEGSNFTYTQSFANVTSQAAFNSGAATKDVPQLNHDGIGAGTDTYVYRKGGASNFPPHTEWVSFQPMWSNNLHNIHTSCSSLGVGTQNTDTQITDLFDAIQNRSTVSLVDHRLILAIILQESQGCVHVGSTTSAGGIKNPGLMQSHNGGSFSSSHQSLSILAMVQDGTQGTSDGDGLVQLLNKFGNPYKAARVYNSGSIPADGNLSGPGLGTDCYVSDIANRLTGWVKAPSKCPS